MAADEASLGQQPLRRSPAARYARSGHLVYASRGSLLAAPFDVERLELTGAAVPVIERVMMGLPYENGIAEFAVSQSGKRSRIWLVRCCQIVESWCG